MSILASSNAGTDYEKVKIDEWIEGDIKEVETKLNVKKIYKDADGNEEEKTIDQVRFIFKLDGYKFTHRSRLMTISTHEKSTLYKDFLVSLFPTLKPGKTVDLEMLKNKRVKTMWDERISDRDDKTYQFLSKIKLLNNDDGKFHIVVDKKEEDVSEVPF